MTALVAELMRTSSEGALEAVGKPEKLRMINKTLRCDAIMGYRSL